PFQADAEVVLEEVPGISPLSAELVQTVPPDRRVVEREPAPRGIRDRGFGVDVEECPSLLPDLVPRIWLPCVDGVVERVGREGIRPGGVVPPADADEDPEAQEERDVGRRDARVSGRASRRGGRDGGDVPRLRAYVGTDPGRQPVPVDE